MSSVFKEKKKKRNKDVKYNSTVDTIHTKKMNEFQENKKSLEKLKIQLEKLVKKNWKKNNELSDFELEEKLECQDNIKNLKDKIKIIENSEITNKYLLDTSSILFKYYSSKNIEDTNYQTSVLDLFNNKQTEKKKKNCIDQYFNVVDNTITITNLNNYNKYTSQDNIYICKICNNERIFEQSEGLIICPYCGTQEKILIDNDKSSYKDPPREISYFAYKKINHFNEWLAQFQAKETTDIPPEVYDSIRTELKKENINPLTVKQKKIRDTLKKLNLNKYYEHVPHILNRLSGKPAPKIPRQTEEKLRIMFKDIQTPWIKHCPSNRSNFFSYSYVLYKCLELLEEDQFLRYFTLLKSREKLAEQDNIWKLICKDLQWEYIKTI